MKLPNANAAQPGLPSWCDTWYCWEFSHLWEERRNISKVKRIQFLKIMLPWSLLWFCLFSISSLYQPWVIRTALRKPRGMKKIHSWLRKQNTEGQQSSKFSPRHSTGCKMRRPHGTVRKVLFMTLLFGWLVWFCSAGYQMLASRARPDYSSLPSSLYT